jgi:hypothetical protein
MPLSSLRLPAQVWPTWLPKAIAQAERISSLSSILKQPMPPILFSASFQSLLSYSNSTPEPSSRSHVFKSPSQFLNIRPYQQIRTSTNQARGFHTTPSPLSCRGSRSFSTTPASPPIQEFSKPNVWAPPPDISSRPVTIIGAGVLGRRLAVLWASHGSPVNIYDISPSALKSATTYIADSLSADCYQQNTHPGHVHFSNSFSDAISNAWVCFFVPCPTGKYINGRRLIIQTKDGYRSRT